MLTTQRAKRLSLSLALSMLIAISGMAEGLWGIKASLDVNKPGKWKVGDYSTRMYTSGLGFSVGGVYTHYFTDGFYVEPSLSVFYDTNGCDFIVTDDADSATSYTPSMYKAGLRLPVMAGYTFDITDSFAIAVFTGPELDYAFAGAYRSKDSTVELGPLLGKDGAQRRLSCSWKGGLGFPFSDWRVDLEVVAGITDILPRTPSCRENRFSVSLLRYF